GCRAHRYHTIYFDTADFALYRRHHAGGRNRYKVRLRTYLDSDRTFAEVKHKVSADRTLKHRLATAPAAGLAPEVAAWLAAVAPLDPAWLAPVLWNDFSRVTLVSLAEGERVTLDIGLGFGAAGRLADLPALVVAEVKQSGINRRSPFIRAVRGLGEHQTGLSKYCTGAALLYDHLPRNNLKPTLRRIRAIHEDLQ
ncbi:MAG TPA: polyphosphate polymerase domain-containing protein, partial [Herpetosiphonaceae bacterium]|nr:polyphosphate polymerase domain-containing protein [Herpetosiphonaceae bacterium]